MPVTFTVAPHPANKVAGMYSTNTPEKLLSSTWGQNAKTARCKEFLQSSLGGVNSELTGVAPCRNGFVDTVMDAYNKHYHLVLKPDDVWIAILAQFNLYINKHAEQLRSHFVAHEEQKKLTVSAEGSRYSVNFGNLAKQMTDLIHENVVDKELKDWILPRFSTTTHSDIVISAVLMMSTLKAYFSYRMRMMACGIPSVTLEGERSDWVKLLEKIDKFETFGKEPTAWAALLRPIIRRFVQSFDGEHDLNFWNKVCHRQSRGSGTPRISGWITAFCVWSDKGEWQGPPLDPPSHIQTITPRLELDGVRYCETLNPGKIPIGFCEVEVNLDDNGAQFNCMMVSGHLARKTTGENMDTVSPIPAWFMFVKEACEDQEEVAIRKMTEEINSWGYGNLK